MSAVTGHYLKEEPILFVEGFLFHARKVNCRVSSPSNRPRSAHWRLRLSFGGVSVLHVSSGRKWGRACSLRDFCVVSIFLFPSPRCFVPTAIHCQSSWQEPNACPPETSIPTVAHNVTSDRTPILFFCTKDSLTTFLDVPLTPPDNVQSPNTVCLLFQLFFFPHSEVDS